MKADRLVSILLLLQSAQRRTARELAERLEVSERTIYRDVDALSASGIPVYAERGAEGGIALAQGYRKALLHFAEEDIRALFIGGANALADLGLGANVELALEKLRGGLSDAQRSAAEKARGRIHIDQRRWYQNDPPTEKLALLRRAVWDDRRIELSYEDRMRAQSTRVVDPYGLVSKAGVWYVVARTEDGYRSFRADRIRLLRELDERFERDASFDLDAHWRETMSKLRQNEGRYVVTVRVTSEALPMVMSYWPSEPVSGDDEACVRITFPSEDAAVSTLLSWGESIELIDPDALRARIVDHARRMIARYADSAAIR